MPRGFTVTVARKMGVRRAGGRGFVAEAEIQVVDFYREVVQRLRAWRPPAPQIPEEAPEVAEDVDERRPLDASAAAQLAPAPAAEDTPSAAAGRTEAR